MNLPTRIGCFKGPWAFMSNFWPGTVKLWVTATGMIFSQDPQPGVWNPTESYSCVECAYQAGKYLAPKIRERFQFSGLSGSQAKALSEKLKSKIRADWKEVNIELMRGLLKQKFTPSILRRKLIATFQAELIEGNWWSDEFWGVCHGCTKDGEHEPRGLNHLGKLLMEIRDGYLSDNKSDKR